MTDSDALLANSDLSARTGSLLGRYTRPATPTREQFDAELDLDSTDDHGSFGWLRGVRERALMLELRKKDGHVKALAYAWLQIAEFEPSTGITLLFSIGKVRITGPNLNAESRPQIRLFDGLVRHKVTFIQEARESDLMQSDPHFPVVERIEW